jgi:hypothetical protein
LFAAGRPPDRNPAPLPAKQRTSPMQIFERTSRLLWKAWDLNRKLQSCAKPMSSQNTKAMMFAATSVLPASAGSALADDKGTAEQQQDCMGDALAWCGEYVFAPDRNLNRTLPYCELSV